MDLNTIWFGLFGVLIMGYAVLDGFDLGVGALSLFAKGDHERRLHFNAIGPVWDGNEVWLLTGGGALFAAFPPVYASVFSGFYLALMLLLLALILRAVSFEFRGKVDSARWRAVWDMAFGVGSLLPAILFGVAVGNIMRGIPLDAHGNYTGGFFDLLNPYAVGMGLLSLTMFVTHGALYLAMKSDGELSTRLQRYARWGLGVWVSLFAVMSAFSLAAAPALMALGLRRALTWAALGLVTFGLVGIGLFLARGQLGRAFLASATAIAGAVMTVGTSLYPALVPSLGNTSHTLTIYNAASTPGTLTVMLVIALVGMPLVIGYTAFIYWVFRGKVVLTESSY